ncbi:MAG: 1-acyl-sn-glycerol-3-phosphate acyltransferase [Tannerella sp.]|jgi:1-acyl-sn-glycerol-3-phosphate acyltransferase|nr:1-acyl-sn-glycerol-3-phosphate acyltransferase [Tannerella sp.]
MMSIDYSKYNFDDIRPLNDDEVQGAIEELVASEGLKNAIKYIMPNLNWEEFTGKMRQCKTKEQFKTTLAYQMVIQIAKNTTFSLTISGRSRVSRDIPSTFISNHRDIVLDAAFLNALLMDIGQGMTQIAIGDNLLIHPWIELVVRLSNSFIVRRNMPVHKLLKESLKLSSYIRYTISELKESVWIAQREGRSKDSNDQTQTALLKMLNMGGDRDNVLKNLMDLHIVPIAISYEYDPCDYLKAKEFQQKRDNPGFLKSTRDDLLNMETGLLNNKGRVHFTLGSPINEKLKKLENKNLDKNTLTTEIAGIIDKEIYKHYRFYPCNYVAYDLLYHSIYFRTNYDLRDKIMFENYLQNQIDKIDLPDKDEVFLRTKILEMYSNPLKNHIENLE